VLRLRDVSLAQMSPPGSPTHVRPLVFPSPEAVVRSVPNHLPLGLWPQKLWVQASGVFFSPSVNICQIFGTRSRSNWLP